jgi:AAA domain
MRLGNGVNLGEIESDFTTLALLPMLVLVGVTGVGKSTTLKTLRAGGLSFSSLPDRREVTDAAIFGGEHVTDRAERFRRTAEFRQTHPGGMAEALEQISVNLSAMPAPILFDGLRGLNEVQHAAHALPRARFVALDAPDTVRVRRLLGRGDRFDQVSSLAQPSPDRLEALRGIEGLGTVFSEKEIQLLAQLEGSSDEIAAKVSIVVTERRHYDPKTANAFLRTLPGERVLYADTDLESPAAVARRIAQWWDAQWWDARWWNA